ncbi:hypothetical protein [Candidatus Electronema sp. TJ]|uniref:hypothetical protein n=1 Tax=Candidatus Electronema sp. TJ TaxID=3401573 RepID=UPI003AA88646
MSNHESMFMEHNPEFEAENFLFEQHEQPEFESEGFLFEQHEHGEGEVFSEAELMELAGELMEVNSEAELDRFLGKLIRNVGSGIKTFANSSVGRAIGGTLKGLAQKALPLAGTVAGGFFGGPLGAKLGGGLARFAANALELETLEAEDREFEGAKNFVRICGEAAKKALATAPNANPTAVAQKAVASVVAKHAPGLMRQTTTKPMGRQVAMTSGVGRGQSGRWVRKGNSIVLLNAA